MSTNNTPLSNQIERNMRDLAMLERATFPRPKRTRIIAVANMSKLVRMTSKLIAPGGSLVALKGRRAPIEVDEASAELRRHHLRAEIHEVPSIMEDESTYVVVCTRIK